MKFVSVWVLCFQFCIKNIFLIQLRVIVQFFYKKIIQFCNIPKIIHQTYLFKKLFRYLETQ